ncbi:SRPBCC family protein, partial [Streptomyces sp. SID7499]|nr:SRPBCC family protein [Streptomyces sp. SID7499]
DSATAALQESLRKLGGLVTS